MYIYFGKALTVRPSKNQGGLHMKANGSFRDRKIGSKLTITFMAVIACFVVALAISVVGLVLINNKMTYFYETPYVNTTAQWQLRRNVQSSSKNILWSCTTADAEFTNTCLEIAEKDLAGVDEQYKVLKDNFDDKALLDKLAVVMEEEKAPREKMMQLARDNQLEEAITYFNDTYGPITQKIVDILNEVGLESDELATKAHKDSQYTSLFVYILIAVISVLSIALSIFLSRFLSKSLTRPISELEAASKELARGNLEVAVSYESNDELGSLAAGIKSLIDLLHTIIPDVGSLLGQMADGNFNIESKCPNSYLGSFEPLLVALKNINVNLSDTLSQIKDASVQVQQGAQNMADGAQSLAEGATDQASSVQELTATMNSLTEQVEENAVKASNASKDAKKIGNEAQQSQEHMEHMTTAMTNISQTSKQIENIINSIESIATQTNLLSLNAAIEAARAGEAGRGFAVVADEIGELASQSAQAATNTRNLIQASLNEIQTGSMIVGETSESLRKVLSSIQEIIVTVNGVTDSSNQQAEAMSEVNHGIEQISGVIQSTSATAEESSAISEELFAQSESLNGLISNFILKK